MRKKINQPWMHVCIFSSGGGGVSNEEILPRNLFISTFLPAVYRYGCGSFVLGCSSWGSRPCDWCFVSYSCPFLFVLTPIRIGDGNAFNKSQSRSLHRGKWEKAGSQSVLFHMPAGSFLSGGMNETVAKVYQFNFTLAVLHKSNFNAHAKNIPNAKIQSLPMPDGSKTFSSSSCNLIAYAKLQ